MNFASAKTTSPDECRAAANSIFQKKSDKKGNLRMAAHGPGLAPGRRTSLPNKPTRESTLQRYDPPSPSMSNDEEQSPTPGAEFQLDTKLFDQAKVDIKNIDGKYTGSGYLKINEGKVKGIKSATINVKVDGEAWNGTGTVETNIPGFKQGKLTARYDPKTGYDIGGSLTMTDDIPGVKGGKLEAKVTQNAGGEGYQVKAGGKIQLDIPGIDAEIEGDYDDGAFTARGTAAYENEMLSGNITAGVTNRAADKEGNPAGGPTENLTVFGNGILNIRIAPWLEGNIETTLKPGGEIEASGDIGIPGAREIFPARSFDMSILPVGIDIPIWGGAVAGQRVGIFATISGEFDLESEFGPGTLEDLGLKIYYSTTREEKTKASGTALFVIPAHAALNLFIRGGLGGGASIVSASLGLEIGGNLDVAGEARAEAQVDWTPAGGLSLEAVGNIAAEPEFTFDVNGFALVTADVMFIKAELYKKKWQLADFNYGSGERFGVTFPIRYREGEPFNISFNDVQFEYPDIEPGKLLGGLMAQISGGDESANGDKSEGETPDRAAKD